MSGWALIYLGVLQKWGVSMFEGGTGLPAALIRCLDAHGGRVRCAAQVSGLIVERSRVTGVAVDGGDLSRRPRRF